MHSINACDQGSLFDMCDASWPGAPRVIFMHQREALPPQVWKGPPCRRWFCATGGCLFSGFANGTLKFDGKFDGLFTFSYPLVI